MRTKVLTGLAASPGIHVGKAFVAERPKEVVGRPVGVLVIKTSSMDWLEAIIGAGAVVTEVGGRTSHAASICRELGKPCVTAVTDVTSIIPSGARVSVDGGAGTVTILPA